ncbi:MAG: Ig-like domain-containing protein [Bacteroidales bacterium]|nr:Ig-like domain-containing protein [Bacteroidales bacterium]
MNWILLITTLSLSPAQCDKKEDDTNNTEMLRIQSAKAGDVYLSAEETTTDVPAGEPFTITFSKAVDTTSAHQHISLQTAENNELESTKQYSLAGAGITLKPVENLEMNQNYHLLIDEQLKGADGSTFPGITFDFKTEKIPVKLENLSVNGQNFLDGELHNVAFEVIFEAQFNQPLEASDISSAVTLQMENTDIPLNIALTDEPLKSLRKPLRRRDSLPPPYFYAG